jgi:hypothetical protein
MPHLALMEDLTQLDDNIAVELLARNVTVVGEKGRGRIGRSNKVKSHPLKSILFAERGCAALRQRAQASHVPLLATAYHSRIVSHVSVSRISSLTPCQLFAFHTSTT